MKIHPFRALVHAAVLVASCAISFAQSDVVGWGRNRFNSAYNRESFTQVSAGHAYSLALRPDGTIAGWGLNQDGALDVPELPIGETYVQISGALAGWASAALRSDGSAVVWGDNSSGQWNVPALSPGQSYLHVSAGGAHIVALRSDGAIVAWGDNSYGQCDVPALPAGLTYVQAEALAGSSLARRSDGAILVWGYNADDQTDVPSLPPGLTYVDAAVGYFHILATRSDGAVVTWGYNINGQCDVPALPPDLSWVKFAGGTEHSLGLRSDGSLVAWGANASGQCNVPPLPPGLTYLPQMASGGWSLIWGQFVGHNVVLRSDGSVVCWGQNDYFECNAPRIPAGVSFAQVSMGGTHQGLPYDWGELHALALLSDGSVTAFGRQNEGQCNVPALPSGVTYAEVDAGNDFFSVARRSDGQVVAWGENSSGQCNVPALPPGLSYTQVDTGYRHSVACRNNGSIVAWGENSYGQCNVPTLPPELSCVEVAASWRHSMARLSDGSVVAWGSNAQGQCDVPAPPPGVSYVEIDAGGESSFARRSDGMVVAWGDNSLGQCNVPALPAGLTYVEISADAEFDNGTWARSSTLARRSDGAIVAWGDTSSGQADVPTLPPGNHFQELAAGGLCTMARVGDSVPCGDWNLARDFRVSPNQENPNRDTCGNPGVWQFLESASASFPAHDPASYSLLQEFITDAFYVPGLEAWQGTFVATSPKNKLPVVGINNSGSHQSVLGIEWPAGVAMVHPLDDQFVVVGWRSPATGMVTVSGGVTDIQPGGSDGIGWSIDLFDGQSNTTLASGSIDPAGTQQFQNGVGGSSLASVMVEQGDFLYFVVEALLDGAGDSTGLEIVITPAVGCGTWSNYCAATPNSSGMPAGIWCSGILNVAANDMRLNVSRCPPQHVGIFFFGQYRAQIPLADGYLCVSPFAPGLFRLYPVVWTDANGHGERNLDFMSSGPTGLITPGSTWYFQFWYRDWIPGGSGTNLSDGMRVTFCP